jgi:beta-glucosidase
MIKQSPILAASFALLAMIPSGFAQSPPHDAPYRNPSLPLEQRVDDLVSRMTLEEKISQLENSAQAVPRLGIPAYDWWNEGLHGVARAGYATVFPQAIGLAATFDEPLMHRVAEVISTEFRAKYYAALHPDGSSDWYRGLTVWSPNINIFRDPRWGRGQETYGEDPFLTSRMGVAFITGLQGDDRRYLKTLATSKHFAVHSGPESTRHSVDVHASLHDMEDTYLPAFRATVMEAHAGSVMCAYNSLNGQPACANTTLLGEFLRRDWGFQGYVVSDCGAVEDISLHHHFTQTPEQGAAAAMKAGMDIICGDPRTHGEQDREAIRKAVQEGLLSEADLDRALRRLFTARMLLGMFDPASLDPYAKIPPTDFDTEPHRQLALQAARESIVLLKNKKNLLPLKQAPRAIAVIGPDADNLDALVGNYNGTPSKPVTVLSGIRKRFPDAKVTFVEGTGLVGPVTFPIPPSSLFADETQHEHGLKAEYFSNLDLQGPPVLTRIDPEVDFVWKEAGGAEVLPRNFSVRWTGVLVPPDDGEYQIDFTGDDGYRVWLDGTLLFEDWGRHPRSTRTKSLHLEKGHAYALKIEYFETTRGAQARLLWTPPGDPVQDAGEAARNSDLVVMVLGLSPTIEGEEMKVQVEGFSGGDRTRIDLPAPQKQLLERVVAVGKPTVLVLLNGSALAVNWADENVPAILEAWYPGGEGGTAVAEALAGDFSPAGRLPVTFYKSVDQLPPFEDYAMAGRTYRYFQGEPLYPFGYGLSYTSFAYSKPKVNHRKITADDSVTLSVEVENTGPFASDEVVQLYLTHPGVAGAPIRALCGFQRLHFNRGEKRTVSFTLSGRDLSIVDEAGKRRIVPGKVEAWIGGGQPGSPPGQARPSGVSAAFSITSESMLPN